jgi:hypothetical protein
MLKDKADELFRNAIKTNKKCLNCGTTRNPTCAHIIPRGFNLTRCDTRNAITLCVDCHTHFTDEPNLWQEFIDQQGMRPLYELLWRKAQPVNIKVDWGERCEFLQPIIDGTLSLADARKLEK